MLDVIHFDKIYSTLLEIQLFYWYLWFNEDSLTKFYCGNKKKKKHLTTQQGWHEYMRASVQLHLISNWEQLTCKMSTSVLTVAVCSDPKNAAHHHSGQCRDVLAMYYGVVAEVSTGVFICIGYCWIEFPFLFSQHALKWLEHQYLAYTLPTPS